MNYQLILAAGLLSIAALSGCGKSEQNAANAPAGAAPPSTAAATPVVGEVPDLNDEEDEEELEDEEVANGKAGHEEAGEAPENGNEEREAVSDQEEAPVEDAPAAPAAKPKVK